MCVCVVAAVFVVDGVVAVLDGGATALMSSLTASGFYECGVCSAAVVGKGNERNDNAFRGCWFSFFVSVFDTCELPLLFFFLLLCCGGSDTEKPQQTRTTTVLVASSFSSSRHRFGFQQHTIVKRYDG